MYRFPEEPRISRPARKKHRKEGAYTQFARIGLYTLGAAVALYGMVTVIQLGLFRGP